MSPDCSSLYPCKGNFTAAQISAGPLAMSALCEIAPVNVCLRTMRGPVKFGRSTLSIRIASRSLIRGL